MTNYDELVGKLQAEKRDMIAACEKTRYEKLAEIQNAKRREILEVEEECSATKAAIRDSYMTRRKQLRARYLDELNSEPSEHQRKAMIYKSAQRIAKLMAMNGEISRKLTVYMAGGKQQRLRIELLEDQEDQEDSDDLEDFNPDED